MPRRDEVEAMRRIVEIREIQRTVAEARAAQAGAAVRALHVDADAQRSALLEDHENWRRTVSGGRSIELSLSLAWFQQVLTSKAEIGRLEAAIETAESHKSRLDSAMQFASARVDAVRELARKAVRNEARRCDEAEIAELADRFSARRLPS